jgi:hypothetical protein
MRHNRYIFLIVFIISLFLFIQIGDQNQNTDIQFENYIYNNITDYKIIITKFKVINEFSSQRKIIWISKVGSNEINSGNFWVSLADGKENITSIKILTFDENGKIIESYNPKYEINNNTAKIYYEFTSGYHSIIVNLDSIDAIIPEEWTDGNWRSIKFEPIIYNNREYLFESFEFEIPIPKSHDIEIQPYGTYYKNEYLDEQDSLRLTSTNEGSDLYVPASYIKVGDESIIIKYEMINSEFQDKIKKSGYSYTFPDDNSRQKIKFITMYRYKTVTSSDIIYSAAYSFVGVILLGFILFLIEWRKIENEKK